MVVVIQFGFIQMNINFPNKHEFYIKFSTGHFIDFIDCDCEYFYYLEKGDFWYEHSHYEDKRYLHWRGLPRQEYFYY